MSIMDVVNMVVVLNCGVTTVLVMTVGMLCMNRVAHICIFPFKHAIISRTHKENVIDLVFTATAV
ncbi:hypothetical protein ccbrp13_62900 [Ktedonobacteria bacterium brp13]|nr:hypothetical protein ccbrp13_62900 [Ktedonobacteria bacterium brp13]